MPNLRVLHVSDLHAGTHEEPEVEADLVELVQADRPRGRPRDRRSRPPQQARASRSGRRGSCARSSGRSSSSPGTTTSLRGRRRAFCTRSTQFRAALARDRARLPLRAARRLRAQLGAAVAAPGRRALRARSSSTPPACSRRHLRARSASSRSTTTSSARPGGAASGRSRARGSVLGALVDAGAELIVSGHAHQSAVSERREFEVAAGPGARDDRRHRAGPGSAAARAGAASRAGCTSSRPTSARCGCSPTPGPTTAGRRSPTARFPRGTEPLSTIG